MNSNSNAMTNFRYGVIAKFGWLNNRAENADSKYQKKIAGAIANAVKRFFMN